MTDDSRPVSTQPLFPHLSDLPRVVCIGCGKVPAEIDEYIEGAANYGSGRISPAAYVQKEEGTYNDSNGHFLCTSCYIAWGMPSSPTGWTAP